MNLLESLLDAIVRLAGDALVMHVGEKPYVVTTASSLNAPRGPLSWGQVELSSRVLTADAVLGMLGQILPLEQRQELEEIGAVAYEIPPSANIDERFKVVAARGGDDVWLEVRRRPKAEPVQAAEPAAASATEVPTGSPETQAAATSAAPPEAVAAPVAASSTPAVNVESEDNEEEEVFEISLTGLGASAPAVGTSPPPFEVVPDISQSVPTDDEVDALLASMVPEATTHAESPASSDEPVEIRLDPTEQAAPAVDIDSMMAEAADVEEVAAGAEPDRAATVDVTEEPAILEPVEIELPVSIEETVAIDEVLAIGEVVAIDEPPAAIASSLPEVVSFAGPAAVAEVLSISEAAPVGESTTPIESEAAADAIPTVLEAALATEPAAVAESGLPSELEPVATTAGQPVPEAAAAPAEAAAGSQPSAIADARAAFEAFVLTPPEPSSVEAVSEADDAGEAVAVADTSAMDALPFEVEPEIIAPAASEAEAPAHGEMSTPPVVAPPARVAQSPAVAEALAAAAAALDRAAEMQAVAEQPRTERPAVAAPAHAEPATGAPAASLQEAPAAQPGGPAPPVQPASPVPSVQVPAAARGPDLQPIAAPPAREAAAPPIASEPPAVAARVVETPAAAAAPVPEAPARPTAVEPPAAAARVVETPVAAVPPVREPAAATIDEPRAAVVVPISRSPVRPETPAPTPTPSLAPLEHMLRIAAARGASTVYVVAQSKPMIRVDGEISALDSEATFSAADVERVVMDLAPARGRDAQTGAVEWMSDVPEVGRVRCVTFRDHRGPGVIFRMIPPRAISADQLGLSAEVQSLCALPDGLVLIAGARASGKSTLLSAFVDLINRTRSDHVISIESQINFVHESRKSFVSQREVRGDAEAAAAAVRSAFREDPDVLVIEDLRTAEIASVAIEAAESGRLVLGSLSAPSTTAAIERLVELFSPERRAQVQTALAGALRGVVAQVLLRKMKGGRIAAREVLLNTHAVATLILENRMFQLPVALEAGRRHGMVPLNDSLVALVRDGTVHVAEAYRKALDRDALLALLKRDGIDTSFAERLA